LRTRRVALFLLAAALLAVAAGLTTWRLATRDGESRPRASREGVGAAEPRDYPIVLVARAEDERSNSYTPAGDLYGMRADGTGDL
jgi:hypothetical protein